MKDTNEGELFNAKASVLLYIKEERSKNGKTMVLLLSIKNIAIVSHPSKLLLSIFFDLHNSNKKICILRDFVAIYSGKQKQWSIKETREQKKNWTWAASLVNLTLLSGKMKEKQQTMKSKTLPKLGITISLLTKLVIHLLFKQLKWYYAILNSWISKKKNFCD